MAEWEDWDLAWSSVNDGRVCPDCLALQRMAPRPFREWQTTPGAKATICGDRCRCIFISVSLIEPFSRIEEKTVIDIGGLDLKMTISEVEIYRRVSNLVYEYELKTKRIYGDDFNLPLEFYTDIQGGKDREEYLKRLIRKIENDTLTEKQIQSIISRNKWMRGKFPERVE